MARSDFVVFTDLDGSLLNHDDYSFEDAIEAVEFLKRNSIPLIIVTSKTKQEVLRLQKLLGIDSPFIVENGAAIFFKEEGELKEIVLGVNYRKIREFIEKIKDKYSIKGFRDMSLDEIIAYTGLDLEIAKISSKREYSEPFLVKDERVLSEVEKLAEKEGLKIMKGGRFYHCMSVNQDKGKAVSILIEKYKKNNPNLKSIGLGDNYNDIPMLKVVDIPVLIPRYNHKFIDFDRENLIKANFPGAKGWSEALERIFDGFKTRG